MTDEDATRRVDATGCELERAERARVAGADCLFVEGPRTPEEIRAIPGRTGAPTLLNLVYGGNTPILGQAELAEMGYAMVLYANAALQGAVTGMQRVLGFIERVGNKVPHPAVVFIALCVEQVRVRKRRTTDVLLSTLIGLAASGIALSLAP